jgi:2-methylisocitrate lyase-like PEP mutase family enzyme
VSIDLESGYGATAEDVGSTVRLAIKAGAVGCNLEDSIPASGKLRGAIDQAERVRIARRAADEAKVHFFINARTDVFFQNSVSWPDGTGTFRVSWPVKGSGRSPNLGTPVDGGSNP